MKACRPYLQIGNLLVQNVFDNSVTPATLLYLVYKPSSWMWPTCAQKFWQKRKECFNTDKSDVWNRLYNIIREKSDHVTYFQNK